MPIPRFVASVNRTATNRVMAQVVPHFGSGGVIVHAGRTSGTEYRTPVLAFGFRGGFVVALTYGRDSDWVKNVVAAGGCRIERGGEMATLDRPRLVDEDEVLPVLPGSFRLALSLLNVHDFLVMDRTAA